MSPPAEHSESRNPTVWIIVGVAVLVAVALIVTGGPGGSGAPGADPEPTPTGRDATPTPSGSPAPASPSSPTPPTSTGTPIAPTGTPPTAPFATATTPASPSPSPTRDALPLVGRAIVEDRMGDVADSAGVPPVEPEPAVDLREVEMAGDGESLAITWRVGDRVPIRGDFLVWSVDLFTEGEAGEEERAYSITVQQSGLERFAGVLDWATSAQTALPDQPEVDEDAITVTVPGDLLERIDGAFTWQAVGQLDGGYEDYAPDGQERAPFPDPEAEASESPTATPAATEG
jgi:hypothetical protein